MGTSAAAAAGSAAAAVSVAGAAAAGSAAAAAGVEAAAGSAGVEGAAGAAGVAAAEAAAGVVAVGVALGCRQRIRDIEAHLGHHHDEEVLLLDLELADGRLILEDLACGVRFDCYEATYQSR